MGAVRADLPALLQAPVVVHRSQLARRQEDEEAAGARLAAVFVAEIADRLHAWLGACAARGVSPVLLIDSPAPEVLDLPWELLTPGPRPPSLEEGRGGVVARLADGLCAPRELRERTRALLWSPTPAEPRCAAAVNGLSEALGGAGVRWAPDQRAEEDAAADLLIIVCHGEHTALGGLLDFGAQELLPGTVAALLRAQLARGHGVLLGVCEGGAPTEAQLCDLAGRLLLAGAPLVWAPGVPVSVPALVAFGGALVDALSRGEPPTLATRAARQAVGLLLSPHPDSRPHTFRLQAADLDALERPWVRDPGPRPDWVSEDPALMAWIRRAMARAEVDGWLGLEHLLATWPEGAGRLCADLRRMLTGWTEALGRTLACGLTRRADGTGPPGLSPRLARVAAALAPDDGIDALAERLIRDPSSGLHALAERPLGRLLAWDPRDGAGSGEVWNTRSEARATAPARALEVLWGPQDGLTLRPEPGQVLGRADPQGRAQVALYLDTPALDRLLRQEHLRWMGPGEAELLHSARLLAVGGRPGQELPVRGPLRWTVGEILMLSPSTWLRGVG